MNLNIPVTLGAGIIGIEVDVEQASTDAQLVIKFYKADGTVSFAKGSLPTITESGATITLSSIAIQE